MKRTVGWIMIFLMISKVFGFFREVAIAGVFGATFLADVYKSSLIVPGIVVQLFTTGLNASLIPVLSSAEKHGKREDFFQNLLTVIMLVSMGAFLLILIFAAPMTKLFVPGYGPDKLAMTIKYTRIVAIIAPLQVLVYSIVGWLQQRERFYIAALVGIPLNLIIIAGAVLNRSGDLSFIIVATILGYLAQFLWVLYPYLRSKPAFNLQPTLKDPYLRMLVSMIVPVLITLAAGQINILVDIALASGLGDGIVANMDYANRVNLMFQSVLVLSLSSVLFTKQSKLSSQDDRPKLFEITKQNLSLLLLIIIPISLGTMFLSREIMTVLFVRGRYTLEAAVIGGGILFFYAPTIATRAVMEIIGKMFFSLQLPKKMMLSTFVMIGVNIGLNFILVRFFGAYGLALATSLASFVGLFILLFQVKEMFRQENMSLYSPSLTHYLIAGGVMLSVLYLLRWLTPFSRLSALPMALVSALLGGAIYFGILYYFRTEEMLQLIDQLKQLLKRGRR
ncbi:MAG TPA: murein biosynthesis integral membrane protein MurJ [Tissierellia bacterium]|nr:murein biosynthesis integral membrane protein MurJ [Tissierellia bacterium]